MVESGGKGRDGKYWLSFFKDGDLAEFHPTTVTSIAGEFVKLEWGEPQLKFWAKTLGKLGASLEVVSNRVKNNERAQEYRNCGNDLFSSNGDLAKVAEMYTKSIAYALPGSQELALAYANRSAVSFKAEDYEGCLLDIERSFENNYLEEMKAKLFARRIRCLVALKKPHADVEKALEDTREAFLKMDLKASGRNLVEKILTDKNHMAPTTPMKNAIKKLKLLIEGDDCDIRGATGTSVQYSKKYGRHLIATRDIRPGEIIAVIENYGTVRSPDKCYRECAQCTKKTSIGIPCDHCVNVVYCSNSCRDKAWNDYHEIECPILGVLLDLEFESAAILCIKTTLRALKEAGSILKLKNMLKTIDSISDPRIKGFTGNIMDCTKYACIYTLTSNLSEDIAENYCISVMSTFAIYYLATRTEIFGQKYDTNLQIFDKNPLVGFLGGLMMRNFDIVRTNVQRGFDGGEDVSFGPFNALCNHCCDSNVATIVGSNKSITLTVKPIKANEQIWQCYQFQHYGLVPKAQRQQLLKETYNFTCECVACIENWPMFENLPVAMEIPRLLLSPATRGLLQDAKRALSQKCNLIGAGETMFAIKDELVRLLELLHEHACPSKDIITYRSQLVKMYHTSLNLF